MESQVNNEIIEKFMQLYKKFYNEVDEDFEKYKANPSSSYLRTLKKKYPHLRRCRKRLNKRSKIREAKAFVVEILNYYNETLTPEDREIIIKHFVKKIKGIYKHAQALKTGYCNQIIMNGFSENNTISICITKNTLEANWQWLIRLFKELNTKFPHIPLCKKIMIISSKKNNLNGQATHCKTKLKAWEKLMNPNDFKIIFVCSNKTRIGDVLGISQAFQNLREGGKDLRIIHDEAHNAKEGIPPYRDIIENIIIQPNVLSYTPPTTASMGEMSDDGNPLWVKQNLENNARNYTDFDDTKSDDPHYSSCHDAIRHNFEDLMSSTKWENYNKKRIPLKIFTKTYSKDLKKFEKMPRKRLIKFIKKFMDGYKGDCNSEQWLNAKKCAEKTISKLNTEQAPDDQKLIKIAKRLDCERKRTLEFCQMMKYDHEILALNNGRNCLKMNELLDCDYFQKNIFNLHIISNTKKKMHYKVFSRKGS